MLFQQRSVHAYVEDDSVPKDVQQRFIYRLTVVLFFRFYCLPFCFNKNTATNSYEICEQQPGRQTTRTSLGIGRCTTGHAVTQLAEALRYKPEGCGFDSRWVYWDFSLT